MFLMRYIVSIVLLISLFENASSTLDPECYLTVPEIANYFHYPSQAHIVRTEDDYILELHRIPLKTTDKPSSRPVIFLQHGLLADANNFLPNLPSQSAATVFSDAGFDVWMGNSRGTPPSQKHIGFGPSDNRFWNFTWEDMSEFDLKASIKYVLKETQQDSLYYVGHSQGTIIMFAKLAEDPEFASKIRQFHALAPVATVSHIGGLFKIIGERLMDVAKFILYRVPNSPLMFPHFLQRILSTLCSLPIAQDVCTLDIGIVDGREHMFNMSRVGVYLCHMPAATSVKNLLHWIQIVKSKKFEKFDYGPAGNQLTYNQTTPPEYQLQNIKTPTFLYWSKDDILADTDDIRDTILAKMNKTIRGSYQLPHYTHLDFVFGLNATHDVYLPMIKTIQSDFDNSLREKFHKLQNKIIS